MREHLGPEWVGRIILTSDKTAVKGDVLIDDKPKIVGAHHPVWKHLLFSAPYNTAMDTAHRLSSWSNCVEALRKIITSASVPLQRIESSATSLADEGRTTKQAIAALPDFSHLLPPDYRKDYAAWRGGRAQGAKGELKEAMFRMQAMQDSMLNSLSEDFTEVHIFRQGYAQWRRGRSAGAHTKDLMGAKGVVSQL